MAAKRELRTRNYDLFKGLIALALAIIIVFLALQGRSTRGQAQVPTTPTAQAAKPTDIPTALAAQPTDVPTAQAQPTAVPTAEAARPTDVPTAAPSAVPAINPPVIGDGGSVSLSGTGQPGATVELWDGDVKLGSATVGPDGAWSWTGTLQPGDHRLAARTVDAAGKALNESPAVPVSVPEPPAEVAVPAINPPVIGDGGSVSLSGTGQPGATVELWDGDVKLGSATVGPDGVWSWTGTLQPGDHRLAARTVDAAGKALNESPAVAVSVPEPPAAAAAPAMNPPQVDAQGTVTLSGTGEPGATIEIVQDGTVVMTAVVQADGAWSATYPAAPGTHEIAARSQADPTKISAAASIDVPQPAAGPAGEGQGYIVQKGDTLSDLAKRFYGNGALWRPIFEATNARAAEDPSFHAIAKPGFIKPGWKIWIPAR